MDESIPALLDERCIALELNSVKKPEVIAELVALLAKAHELTDREKLIEELLERERLSSTGIGSGIAIPHRLTAFVPKTCIAFGRSKRPIRFDAIDRKPVDLFFLLVGPEHTHAAHLRLLSRLSRYLREPRFVDSLRSAEESAEVLDAFRTRETSG